MSTHRKLMTVCCAAVLTLGLAACGSGDDDKADTPTTEMPDPMPTAAEQLAAAQMAVAGGRTAVDALTAASSPSEIAAAHSALAAALAQLANASAIPENTITLLRQDIASLQMQLDDLQDEIDAERVASANAQMAVTGATTALDAAEMAAATAQTALEEATMSLTAASAALVGATGEDQAAAVLAYTAAQAAVVDAATEAGAKEAEADTARDALMMANAALAEIDPNHVDLLAAEAALDAATKRADAAEKKRDELQMAADAAQMAADDAAAELAAKPGLDPDAMALVAAITAATPSTVPEDTVSDMTGAVTDMKHTATAEADLAISSIAGWQGSESVRETEAAETTPASTDTIVVYNNKEAPTPTAYGKVYNEANDDDNLAYSIVDDTGVIMFTDDSGAFSKMIMAAKFDELVNGASKTFDGEDDAATDENVVAGTFHGVPGGYTCTVANGCLVMRSNTGVLTFAANDWTFTPDKVAGEAVHMVDVADADYMHIGYWMKTSTDKDGDPTAMIAAISGGTMATPYDDAGDVAGVRGIEGSASYAGSATGGYVRKEVNSVSAEPEHLYHGQFTADAALTAYFGGDDVAVSKQDSIHGTISGFKNAAGEDIDTSWTVTLESAEFGADTDLVNGAFSGATEGDKGSAAGSWSGQFFGAVTLGVADDPDSVDTDDTVAAVYPSGVAGTFDGHFTNGHVLGAFGADEE